MVIRSRKKKEECSKVELKKDIGILKGVSLVVGTIVGSGIFLSPVGVLRHTHSIGLSFIMWVVAGLFSALGAMVYAELGVTIPRSGGEYIYVLETFGPFLAFMVLWITFFVIGTVTCAVNSLVLANYVLRPFFATCDLPASAVHLVALLALLTLCFINCYRVSWATKLSVVFTAGKVIALLLTIGFGFAYLAGGQVSSFQDPFEDSATSPGALASAFYQGFWSFAGWNYLNFLTGEMKNPARNLPIVIIISLIIVTVIYLLANVAYLAVLSPYEVLNSDAVAVTMANRCMGVMAWIMPVFVAASVFGSINGEVLSMSRVCFAGGEKGHTPAVLSMVSVTNLTPIPSIVAMILVSILFQFFPDLYVLIEYTGLAFTIVSGAAVCSLIHIKRTHPELNRTAFKLPMFLPVLYLIVNFSIGIFSIYNGPLNSLIGLGIMAIGIPLYIIGIAWKNKPHVIESALYKFTVTMQKVLSVVQQEAVADVIPVEPREEDVMKKYDVWAPAASP
ncbi:Large neutral amino acids transporter small subunit 2 [Clonorchis sinensis]|uniref:Large neutral amino acids transporter small subunit 2 n=1 Tax=Clonorchis sinensis TaxID=79923 RepID=A0A8T1M919_CLOSI|nr:Large neutral amino acids transporter small subunit 2 [Clonorchis sinensis]